MQGSPQDIAQSERTLKVMDDTWSLFYLRMRSHDETWGTLCIPSYSASLQREVVLGFLAEKLAPTWSPRRSFHEQNINLHLRMRRSNGSDGQHKVFWSFLNIEIKSSWLLVGVGEVSDGQIYIQ